MKGSFPLPVESLDFQLSPWAWISDSSSLLGQTEPVCEAKAGSRGTGVGEGRKQGEMLPLLFWLVLSFLSMEDAFELSSVQLRFLGSLFLLGRVNQEMVPGWREVSLLG